MIKTTKKITVFILCLCMALSMGVSGLNFGSSGHDHFHSYADESDSIHALNPSDLTWANWADRTGDKAWESDTMFHSENLLAGSDYFTLVRVGNRSPRGTSNLTPASGSSAPATVTHSVGTGGAVGVTSGKLHRIILFTASANATVNIWAASSDAARKLNFYKVTGTTPELTSLTVIAENIDLPVRTGNNVTLDAITYKIEAGQYAIGGDTNGIDIYYLEVVEGEAPESECQWAEWETITPATCETNGLRFRYCEYHNPTADPETEVECEEGKLSYESAIIAAVGHTWGEWQTVTAATYTSDGLEERFCTREGCDFGDAGGPERQTRAVPSLQKCKLIVDSTFLTVAPRNGTSGMYYGTTENPVDLGNGFNFVGDAYVDSENVRILSQAAADGTNLTYANAQRFRLSGLSATSSASTDRITLENQETVIPTFNIITFEGQEGDQLVVWAIGGGTNNKNRAVLLYRLGEEGEESSFIAAKPVQATTDSNAGEFIVPVTFDIAEGGTYVIASGFGAEYTNEAAGPCNFYRFSLEHHTWSDWTVTTAATCDSKGAEARTCSECDKTESRILLETSDDGEHTWGDWIVDTTATCTAQGTRHRVCTVCNERQDGNYSEAAHKHDVTLKNGETTLNGGGKVDCGSKFTKPADPTKSGYKFDGWYKDAGCTQVYDFNTLVTGDLTLYAKFTKTGGGCASIGTGFIGGGTGMLLFSAGMIMVLMCVALVKRKLSAHNK